MFRLWRATEPKINWKERLKRLFAFSLDAGLSIGLFFIFAMMMPLVVSGATAAMCGIGASLIIQKRLLSGG
jgi:hypothetical protein